MYDGEWHLRYDREGKHFRILSDVFRVASSELWHDPYLNNNNIIVQTFINVRHLILLNNELKRSKDANQLDHSGFRLRLSRWPRNKSATTDRGERWENVTTGLMYFLHFCFPSSFSRREIRYEILHNSRFEMQEVNEEKPQLRSIASIRKKRIIFADTFYIFLYIVLFSPSRKLHARLARDVCVGK